MPIEFEVLLIFIPVALALNVTPGADMLFCLGQGIKSGPKAGIAASLGIATGSFIHTVLAGLGLATLLSTHPVAFEFIRWSGVTYLVYLAITTLREPLGTAKPANLANTDAKSAWHKGTIVCLLNPKVAIFILALVPQFVDPSKGSIFLQFLIFGTILNIGGTLINTAVGGYAGSIGKFLGRNERFARTLQILTSFVFLGLAARLAFDRR